MKIRNGFVSNSSSSSFVIHKSYLTEEQVKKMKEVYNRLKDSDQTEDYIYDDNGAYFDIEPNYIKFNAYNAPKEWHDLIESLNLPKDAIYRDYN